MKLMDSAGNLRLLCDRCNADLKGHPHAVVGIHGGDVRLFHGGCAAESFQFLRNDADRQLSIPEFLAELQAAAGL
jgi:hypothetical protein